MQEKSSLDFADRLAHALKHSGVKPSHLASNAGVSKGYVSELLKRNKLSPSIETCKKFAEVLNVSMVWLFDGNPDPVDADAPLPPEITNRLAESTVPYRIVQRKIEEAIAPFQDQLSDIQAQIQSAIGDFSLGDLKIRMDAAEAWPPSTEDLKLRPGELLSKYPPIPKTSYKARGKSA